MRCEDAARCRTGLHRDRTHVSVIGVVAVGMMQADIDAEIDLVILRVPPTRVDDLIRICCGIHRAVGNAIVYAVVTIVIHPVTQAVRPIRPRPCITNARLRRRYPWRRRGGTIFARFVACEPNDSVIKSIVGGRMIEDRFL